METQDKVTQMVDEGDMHNDKTEAARRRTLKIAVSVMAAILVIGIIVALVIHLNRQARDTYNLEDVKSQFVAFYSGDGVEAEGFETANGLFNLGIYNVESDGVLYLSNFNPTDTVAKLPEEPILILLVEGQSADAFNKSYQEIERIVTAFREDVIEGVENGLDSLYDKAILVKRNNYYYLILANDPAMVELELKSLNQITSTLKSRVYQE